MNIKNFLDFGFVITMRAVIVHNFKHFFAKFNQMRLLSW